MAEKKIWIAFKQSNTIPGKVLGKDKDVPVAAGTPVLVPETYGKHLIDDKFAVASENPKAKASDKGDDDAKAEAEKAKAQAEKAKAKAEADKAKALADAEKAVADAAAAVEAAGDDMVAKAAAEDDLKAAEAALAGLKG